MGNPRGFINVKRQKTPYRPVRERVKDFDLVFNLRAEEESKEQASRCMDCSTPFCHSGCPVGNYIPEWNDAMYNNQWEKAFALLDATNNLPEITGRVCPAPCEFACVLGINDDPVTCRENELAIIEDAFKKGYVKPRPPKERSGKKVAVVGSGGAGLACAAQLNRTGHAVTVFEKDGMPGGIMRFGIPDFKLEKEILDRRIRIWEKEGIKFECGVNVGKDLSAEKLKKEYDAVVLAGGSRVPRDLKIEGRELKGIHFAMEFLVQSNRAVAGKTIPPEQIISAAGKKVVVIGGGDTGADCVGVSNRQGAKSVVQIELLPRPLECRPDDQPWPKYPMILKTSSSHEEGADRQWSILTKKFIGSDGKVKKLVCVKVDFSQKDEKGCAKMTEVPGSAFEIEADLVLLALGFLSPEHNGLLDQLAVEYDARGNVKTGDNFMTSKDGVFAAGDMHRGQSLIVWAIYEGRMAADQVDRYLSSPALLRTRT